MNSEFIIKVCGMRDDANIRAVERLGPSLMGFIFWPHSSRYAGRHPVVMPQSCRRVGVFVDEQLDEVVRTAGLHALDYIQLHGHESPGYIRQLCEMTSVLPHRVGQGSGIPVIKAFAIATEADLAQTAAYDGVADLFLFDTRAQLPGGSGRQFDWSVLCAYRGNTPFLLSGGIGADDVQRLCDFVGHCPSSVAALMAGIDVNSRFETGPGMKDVALLGSFIAEVKQKLPQIRNTDNTHIHE